jgi:NAD+ kinase
MIERAALLVNPRYPDAIACARELIGALADRGVWVGVHEYGAESVDPARRADAADLANCQLAIAAGGDGTALRAARLVHEVGGIVLAVRFGRFGFLAEVEPPQASAALASVLDGKYGVRERVMAQVVLHPKDGEESRFLALNDAVVTSGAVSRTIDLDIYIGDCHLATVSGDGVIVATPTGASAYTVAAGGPLMGPSVGAFIVTPICPHTLSARALVVSDKEEVRIVAAYNPGRDVALVVDGERPVPLAEGDPVVVSRSGRAARFVDIGGQSFYDKLRSHFWWGDRYRAGEPRVR